MQELGSLDSKPRSFVVLSFYFLSRGNSLSRDQLWGPPNILSNR